MEREREAEREIKSTCSCRELGSVPSAYTAAHLTSEDTTHNVVHRHVCEENTHIHEINLKIKSFHRTVTFVLSTT